MSYIHSTHLIYLVCHQDQLSFESLHWWFGLRDALPPPWVISPRETVPVRQSPWDFIIYSWLSGMLRMLLCFSACVIPFRYHESLFCRFLILWFNFWVAINSDLSYGVSWIGASIESVLLLLRIAILPLPTFRFIMFWFVVTYIKSLVAVAVRRRVLIDMSRCFAYCNLHYCN